MEYIKLTPMQRAILDIYEPRFVDNDTINFVKMMYSEIPDRIYAGDMEDEDYYEFGVFLMGVCTGLLSLDNDNVTRSFRQECRDIRKQLTGVIRRIMHETGLD